MRRVLILVVGLCFLGGPLPGQVNSAAALLSAAMYEEEVSGDLEKAADIYLEIIRKYPEDRPVAAKSLYHLGLITEKMGKQKASDYFNQLIRNYPDQKELVALARAKLAGMSENGSGHKIEADIHYTKARKYLDQWEYTNSIKEFEQVIRLVPGTDQALESTYWTGQAYLRSGNNAKATGIFKSLLRDYPDRPIGPVCELMVRQIEANTREQVSQTSKSTSLDGKSMITQSGIDYRLIKTFTGSSEEKIIRGIDGISPTGSFYLSANYIIPTDNSTPVKLFEIPSSWDLQPSSLAPDGTQVAFFERDTLKLLKISPQTGQPDSQKETLMDGNGNPLKGLYINWSPDGEKLGFLRSTNPETGDLWIMSLKDHQLTKITDTSGLKWNPSFSNDGNMVYYSDGGLPATIWSVRPDGTSLTKVLEGLPNLSGHYFFSSDQQFLISSGIGMVSMCQLSDNAYFRVNIPAEVGSFSHQSPNSDSLVFMRPSYEKYWSVKVISSAGGPPFEVGGNLGFYPGTITWSPDNRKIISLGGMAPASKWAIQAFPINGDEPYRIQDLPNLVVRAISPDCSKTAELVLNTSNYSYDLKTTPISTADGRETGPAVIIGRDIPPALPGILSLHWSPAQTDIAFIKKGELWVYSLDGGIPKKIKSKVPFEGIYDWSPDGTMIMAWCETKDSNSMKIIRVTDGSEKAYIKGAYGWKWSPDGKELAAFFMDGHISLISFETLLRKDIVNYSGMGIQLPGTLSWSPDGQNLLFDGNYLSNPDLYGLFVVSSKGGKPKELNILDHGEKTGLKWSPDGKWIAYGTNYRKKVRLETTLWEASLKDFIKNAVTTSTSYLSPPDGVFTDNRDGHQYGYKKIGNQTWMIDNLAFLPGVNPGSAGSATERLFYVYGYSGQDTAVAKSSYNYRTFGVLYNWPAAMNGQKSSNRVPSGVQGICPAGWHLPSDEEWFILEKHLGLSPEESHVTSMRSSGSVGYKIQAPYGSYFQTEEWKGCNSSGFNSLPGGYRNQTPSAEGFGFYLNKNSYYQSCTEADSLSSFNRIIVYLQFGIGRFPMEKFKGYSVRCVRD